MRLARKQLQLITAHPQTAVHNLNSKHFNNLILNLANVAQHWAVGFI